LVAVLVAVGFSAYRLVLTQRSPLNDFLVSHLVGRVWDWQTRRIAQPAGEWGQIVEIVIPQLWLRNRSLALFLLFSI
jgi:hypothetical protein